MIGRARTNRASRGFILAMLLGLFTVMGIFMTRAMPSVITEVQRDQEEELIYRGEAIRNGIRRYKAITGQYPSKLEDLMKVRPPILRRLYKDPMTREGDWDLVTQVQPGASGDKTGLPIVGVRSRSPKDSMKVYRGKTLYSDWVFSAADDLFGVQGSGGMPQQPQFDPNAGSSGRGGPPPQKGRQWTGGGTQ